MAGPAQKRGPVLVVEDDARLGRALAELLLAHRWHALITATAGAALEAQRATPATAVLLDLGLPDRDGIQLLEELKRTWPKLPVVVLTAVTTDSRILAAVRAGANGYLFKEDVGTGVIAALEEATAGGAPMSRAVACLVLSQLRASESVPAAGAVPAAPLTSREVEIVEQLARGLTYAQVGLVLGISANTVRSYIRAIYQKLAVGSRTEAVLVALRLGLVTTES